MRFRAQTADLARPKPFWLRAATLLCVLLLGFASVAQAAHIHGQWLPHSAPGISKHTAGQVATTEDACPLCVALHSALPMQVVKVPAAVLVENAQASFAAGHFIPQVWHFELFSRPPPVLL